MSECSVGSPGNDAAGSPDEPTAFTVLLAELERLPGCEATKRRVIRLIASHAGERMYVTLRETLRREQVATVRRLLPLYPIRGDLARRIAALYQVSESTAWRIMARARDQDVAAEWRREIADAWRSVSGA